MKKWETPVCSNLKIKTTNNIGECTCAEVASTFGTSKNKHYCHSLNDWHYNGCQATEGHYRNEKCNSPVHWNVAHDSKCCCGGNTNS